MMRYPVCLGALVLAACSSGAPEGGLRSSGPIPISAGISAKGDATHPPHGNATGSISSTTTADLGMQTFVPVPVDSAFTALKRAYLSMGLELATVDAAEHVAGNGHVVVRQKMLGRNLSAFFNCGPDAVMGWPRADHYQVIFSVMSTVSRADADRSRVVTLVTGTASDLSTSASAVYCSSTGLLESTILKAAGYQAD